MQTFGTRDGKSVEVFPDDPPCTPIHIEERDYGTAIGVFEVSGEFGGGEGTAIIRKTSSEKPDGEPHGERYIAEHNRQAIQDALDKALPGETVNVDHLPLLRLNRRAPIAPLCTVPRSAVLTEPEAAAIDLEAPKFPVRTSDKQPAPPCFP